ncbi:MAG: hypothetical protein ACFFCS_03765 [Candidatus Hodarchaeota archaeon]
MDIEQSFKRETNWKVSFGENKVILLTAVEDSAVQNGETSVTITIVDNKENKKIQINLTKDRFLNLSAVMDSFNQVCLGLEPELPSEDYATPISEPTPEPEVIPEPEPEPEPEVIPEPEPEPEPEVIPEPEPEPEPEVIPEPEPEPEPEVFPEPEPEPEPEVFPEPEPEAFPEPEPEAFPEPEPASPPSTPVEPTIYDDLNPLRPSQITSSIEKMEETLEPESKPVKIDLSLRDNDKPKLVAFPPKFPSDKDDDDEEDEEISEDEDDSSLEWDPW